MVSYISAYHSYLKPLILQMPCCHHSNRVRSDKSIYFGIAQKLAEARFGQASKDLATSTPGATGEDT